MMLLLLWYLSSFFTSFVVLSYIPDLGVPSSFSVPDVNISVCFSQFTGLQGTSLSFYWLWERATLVLDRKVSSTSCGPFVKGTIQGKYKQPGSLVYMILLLYPTSFCKHSLFVIRFSKLIMLKWLNKQNNLGTVALCILAVLALS